MQEPNDLTVSIWDYKPWWCQPWSILLTGICLIGGSWLLLHKVWVTVLVAVPVLIWMGFFLLIYPTLVLQSGLLQELQSSDSAHQTHQTESDSSFS